MLNRKARPLAQGYQYEAGTLEEAEWNRLVPGFADANLNQTWAYAAIEEGQGNVCPLLVRRDGRMAALAMARFKRVPGLGIGLAYVHRGPLWRRKDADADPEDFRQAVRALRNEFVCKQGLSLRINPAAFDDDRYGLAAILGEEGFSPARGQIRGRTLVMDLTLPLDAIRQGLGRNWKRKLKQNEQSTLETIEGADLSLFESFGPVYAQMIARKSLPVSEMFSQFAQIQSRLPEELKMGILLCKSEGALCAGLVWCAMGDTGIELLAATSDIGAEAGGSHLLRWRLVERFKQLGLLHYNLNGIDPIANPGTYRFKKELAGKTGRDVCYLGKFDASAGPLTGSLVLLRDAWRAWKKRR